MLLTQAQRRRLLRDSSALLGMGLVGGLVVFAILGPFVAGDPNASDFSLAREASGAPPGPSGQHWFGTDRIFRDTFARLAHGARLSLTVALLSVLLALAIGTAIGVTAGTLSTTRWRRVDNALMRVVDVALAFPYLLLITAIGVAVERADVATVVLILGLTSWTGIARVARAKAVQVAARDYVTAARALGASGWRIAFRHVLPAVRPTLLVIGTHAIAQMILAEAVLGYLTVGVEPPRATWGRMLQEAEAYIGVAPLMVAAPGFCILAASLGFTRLGDGLRDAIEPRAEAIAGRHAQARVLVDALLLACVILVVSLSGDHPLAAPPAAAGAEEPRRGGILHLASTTAVAKLDPAVAYDDGSRAVGDLIYATLLTHDENGRLEGDLAERFATPDGKVFTFALRKGLTFHDGTPLVAADVKRSLERMLHPGTVSAGAHLFAGIHGFADYQKAPERGVAGIGVPDEHTVVIELDDKDVGFLSLMTLGFSAPVCASGGTSVDPKEAAAPCGAGPFMLEEAAEQRITLTRFDHYHDAGKPYLDGVVWDLSMSARTQRYRFEQGELDMITELTGVDAFRFAEDERWAPYLHWVAKPSTNFIFLNTGKKPFDNRNLRRAVAFAVDPSVLPQVRINIGETTRVIPPAVPGPAREPPMRRHDREAALREMELAGYPYDPETGLGGYPKTIDFITIPDTFEQSAAEIFQQQLAAVGVRIRLKLVSFAAWSTLITRPGAVPMGWRGWAADYPDASNFFAPILTSAAITPSGSQNVSFFTNAELDELVARAAHTRDVDERMALFERAEEIVAEEAPLVPVYVSRSMHLVQPRVRGYRPHPVLPLRLRDVWLEATP